MSPAPESIKHFIHVISLKLPDLPIVKVKGMNASDVTQLGTGSSGVQIQSLIAFLPHRCLSHGKAQGEPRGTWEAISSTPLIFPKRKRKPEQEVACPAMPSQICTCPSSPPATPPKWLSLCHSEEGSPGTQAAPLNSPPSLQAGAGRMHISQLDRHPGQEPCSNS